MQTPYPSGFQYDEEAIIEQVLVIWVLRRDCRYRLRQRGLTPKLMDCRTNIGS